jgi:hypothetical protein
MFQKIIKKCQSEGRPREIAIKAPMPGIHMHPTAIPSLIHHTNNMHKDCAMMMYSQAPNEFGEKAVKHYKECDSYLALITRLPFTTYSNPDKARYQQ